MLVTSTLSIVRELDDNYAFIEEIDVPDGLTLNRGSFDIFGDILFVVLGNAAKHGTRDGIIRVSAEHEASSSEVAGQFPIAVRVQSFVASADDHRHAVARIQEAMTSHGDAIKEAAVGEGFSGLRKAVGIISHTRSDQAAIAFYAEDDVRDIRFEIYLPAKLSISRAR